MKNMPWCISCGADTRDDCTCDKMMPFEKKPELADHIQRMASTGATGSIVEWSEFLNELNKALDRTWQ